MLRSVVPGLPKKNSALTRGWLDHSALQAPKVDHCGCQRCSKERQLGRTMNSRRNGQKQQAGSSQRFWSHKAWRGCLKPIGLQHTTESRYGTDGGSTVENRQTKELTVAAPGLPEILGSAQQ